MFMYFAILLLSTTVQGKFYTDCGSKLATVDSVGVSGCQDTASECDLKRDTNASISINLTPSEEVKSIQTIVHGVIMDLPVPFPLPQPNACENSGLTCPLKAGELAHYKTTLPVHKSYPKLRVGVKWELKNEKGEDLVCILINAKLN